MTAAKTPKNLEALLAELDKAARSNGLRVSVEEIMDAVGRRSFGPVLLLTGLLGMTPVAAVPTAPTLLAVIAVLVAAQLLFGRDSFWLPSILLKLSVKAEKVTKTAKGLKKPAAFIDRLIKPRLLVLTTPVADRIVAAACIAIALAIPPLEFVPFAAFIPACALAAFGLGLIARDGALVLSAFLISLTALGLLGWHFLD